jgi:OOP family OmpA-OmpF porin
VGSASYNLALSKKRAESVRKFLVSKGVNGSNLVAQGFGKTRPIASNDTEEGRAENRRVEFVVLNRPPADVKVISKDPTSQSKAAARGGEARKTRRARRSGAQGS